MAPVTGQVGKMTLHLKLCL